jgi:hypothetical protein
MDQQSREHEVYNDGINLYDYWQVIVKRKKLIIGMFLISVIGAAVISLLTPKIYRGETVLKLTTNELTAKELISVIGGRLETVLPKNYHLVDEMKLRELKDPSDKLEVSIYSKNSEKIPDVVAELIEYIKKNYLIKRNVEQQKEKVLRQSEEISILIEKTNELIKAFQKMLDGGKLKEMYLPNLLASIFELNRKASDLKIEKLTLEQTLSNVTGVVLIEQPYVLATPVKPKIIPNIELAAVLGLFAGILLAFFLEYAGKSRRN